MSTSKRRSSYINLGIANATVDTLLSPRTPKSISKSRRSSVVAETTNPRPSSRRGSLASGISVTPGLLSEATTINYSQQELTDREVLSCGEEQSVEEHVSYMIKPTKQSKKQNGHFGQQIPRDICGKDICRDGLRAMLQSKVPLCYFLYHLLEEYSSENLFFFIELEQYETFTYTSTAQQMMTARHIYDTYINRNSYFEVNLDDKVRRSVTLALEEDRLDGCFDAAKRDVYALLESSYMRFQLTSLFDSMLLNCGELITHYDQERRNAAVNQLLHYTEYQQAALNNANSRRRHDMTKSMIRDFCRTLVGVEFEYCHNDQSTLKKTNQRGIKTKDVFDFFAKKKAS